MGLIFSSRFDMTMTLNFLSSHFDPTVSRQRRLTQEGQDTTADQKLLHHYEPVWFSQAAPVSLSYRCFPNHQAALQSVNYRLRALSKWGQRWGRFGWETAFFLCVDSLRRCRPTCSDWRCVWLASNLRREQRGGIQLWRCCSISLLCPWANTARVIKSHGHVCLLTLASRRWPRRWSGRRLMQRFMDVVFFLCGLWFSAHCSLTQPRVRFLTWRILYILYTHTHTQTTRLAVRVCVWLSTLPRCKLAGFVGFKPNLWIFLFCCKLITPQENTRALIQLHKITVTMFNLAAATSYICSFKSQHEKWF